MFMYVGLHVPEIHCTHTKTVSFLLWVSLGGRAIFHDSFFLFIFYDFLDFFIHVFLIVYHSSSIHSPGITQYDCNLQTD